MADPNQQLQQTIKRLNEVLNLKRTIESHPSYFSAQQLRSDVRFVERKDAGWLAKALRNSSYTVEKRLLLGEEIESEEVRKPILDELYGHLKDDE